MALDPSCTQFLSCTCKSLLGEGPPPYVQNLVRQEVPTTRVVCLGACVSLLQFLIIIRWSAKHVSNFLRSTRLQTGAKSFHCFGFNPRSIHACMLLMRSTAASEAAKAAAAKPTATPAEGEEVLVRLSGLSSTSFPTRFLCKSLSGSFYGRGFASEDSWLFGIGELLELVSQNLREVNGAHVLQVLRTTR